MLLVDLMISKYVAMCVCSFFFQAEDGIRDLVRSRGLGDVYKRQVLDWNTPSIEFYKSLGAVPQDEWTVFRVSGEALDLSLIHI